MTSQFKLLRMIGELNIAWKLKRVIMLNNRIITMTVQRNLQESKARIKTHTKIVTAKLFWLRW